ncbi:MAG: SAM-dependent chlorinase/fluorinase [Spirochaetales bacterium]|nr:SAM-dependent chlorinase/fluorinase [Spirochaetales bacterium]
MNSKIVVLLTDFGCQDAYAGIMKGVILCRDPAIRIVDLTHQIAAHDILSGSYVLYTAWKFFPEGSTFCAVVDPGVGSNRGALVAEMEGRYLVAPDNGLISLPARMFTGLSIHQLEIESLPGIRPAGSRDAGAGAQRPGSGGPTFDGRDLFAPAAALCAVGGIRRIRGREIRPVLLPEVVAERGGSTVTGRILHIDRFGNCISSIHSSDLEPLGLQQHGAGAAAVRAGKFQGERIRPTYADTEIGAPLCLFGSSDFLEIAVREGSAAQRFGLSPGEPITVTVADP